MLRIRTPSWLQAVAIAGALTALTAAAALTIGAAAAESGTASSPGVIVKPSAHDVATTLDRLTDVLTEKGLTVFARIDHAQGAANVNLKLAPTELLIFGNPKAGTPLMTSRRLVGLDLPMKALAWRDEAGKVWLAYNAPRYLADRHDIADRQKVIANMTAALDKLTGKAVAP